MNLLSVVLLFPLAGFFAALALPREKPGLVRCFALGVSLAVFVVSIGLALPQAGTAEGYWFETNVQWIHSPAIRFHTGTPGR